MAKKILKEQFGVTILSAVQQVQRIVADINPDKFTRVQGMNIAVVTSTSSDDEALSLIHI